MQRKKVKTKPNYRLRARNLAIRKIAAEDGIPFREASAKYSRGVVEFIYNRAWTKTARRFLEVSPGKFLEVEKGKPARAVNTFGDVRNLAYIERVRRMESYWRTIHIYQETFKVGVEQARRIYKDRGRQYVMEELGTFASYRKTPKQETQERLEHEDNNRLGSSRNPRGRTARNSRSIRTSKNRKRDRKKGKK